MPYYEAYAEENCAAGTVLVGYDATDSEIWRKIERNVVDDYTILRRGPVPGGGEKTKWESAVE